ncbi:polysaccharide pyruvyl transferase family protein [Vibrio parahaemolyticus]|uniref:polysaccharide pyruvyl transferase family protein n=1 Tax=Vibrio parahaemolyticus TaxID=670 RepID=UPI0011224EBF|nr:polysaccharide pyruvyl transferase family protein [Vibrio parahaemolyticus]EGQ8197849.1 polysaccharide pyruvyl transferase family protein [Vibrio parahaemolyticus]ELA6921431.1 polysaccharide pyruvyl transferase family protein [Vibrio parahaemolyticus]MBE4088672.1 polysaccharide pyruvyl transferase family protein [Vibrio parahaemolyticus]MCR9716262.1 polysaccharide pyruvyl transferase family protein [Vibrio parahaemolyticus]MCX8936332.1 polysaccharide pyruvyl transferase family protein [Vibr
MKNILVDFYAHKNLGDDLFVKVLLERYPNHHFSIISSKKNASPFSHYSNVNSVHPISDNLLIRFLIKILPDNSSLSNKILKELWKNFYRNMAKKTDAYINIGGSIFIENEIVSIHHELYGYKIDMLSHMPKFIISANFGPYSNKSFRDKYEQIFSQFEDVCFRESESFMLFSKLDQVRYQYDLILNHLHEINVSKVPNTVGISIIDLRNRPNLKAYSEVYDKYIDNIISKALSLNKSVTLISFCANEGDLDKAKEIKRKFNSIKIIDYQSNIDEFLSHYASLSEVYATRFHAIILALVYKSKLMPISYSQKTINMLKTINYVGNVTEISKNKWYSDCNLEFDLELEEDMCNQFASLDWTLNEKLERTD